MKYIPITEEQFFDSVDEWIWKLTGEGRNYNCGFCKAKDMANAMLKELRDHYCCEDCQAFELCNASSDSPYWKWSNPDDEEEMIQAELEILEGLWKIGKRLGFYGIPEKKMVPEKCKCGQEFYLRAGYAVVSSGCSACGEKGKYFYREGARGI